MTDTAELVALTAIEAAERIATGELSAESYVGALNERIASLEHVVHAFAHHDPDDALAQARVLDERRRSGFSVGPLHGVPVAVKDVFDTADYPTECGSPLLRGRRPMRDSTAVARLRAAGAVIIGKSVTAEFAYFHPGPTRNPHDPERTPGGSSSGSAAAVAAAMAPLAIGTQTAGSTITPASYCGIYGCKPSHGMIARHGALTLSRTLDHVGVFGRTPSDVAMLLDVLAGYDPLDADTRPVAAPAFLETATEDPPLPPRFAFVRTPVWDQADKETRAAFEELATELGANAAVVDLPAPYAAAAEDHRTILAADVAHNLGDIVDRGGNATSQALRDILTEGRALSAARYLAARDAARRYAAGLNEIFVQYDAIVTPATTGVAPRGDATGSPAFCTLWTLVGMPALTLPLLTGEGGMPLGVQLVGPVGDDARLLRTANWLIENLQN
jgi:Asp-tRNA(Asn)/Glu-tRNA(Gln) amidotransferase A subunit family amidase